MVVREGFLAPLAGPAGRRRSAVDRAAAVGRPGRAAAGGGDEALVGRCAFGGELDDLAQRVGQPERVGDGRRRIAVGGPEACVARRQRRHAAPQRLDRRAEADDIAGVRPAAASTAASTAAQYRRRQYRRRQYRRRPYRPRPATAALRPATPDRERAVDEGDGVVGAAHAPGRDRVAARGAVAAGGRLEADAAAEVAGVLAQHEAS